MYEPHETVVWGRWINGTLQLRDRVPIHRTAVQICVVAWRLASRVVKDWVVTGRSSQIPVRRCLRWRKNRAANQRIWSKKQRTIVLIKWLIAKVRISWATSFKYNKRWRIAAQYEVRYTLWLNQLKVFFTVKQSLPKDTLYNNLVTNVCCCKSAKEHKKERTRSRRVFFPFAEISLEVAAGVARALEGVLVAFVAAIIVEVAPSIGPDAVSARAPGPNECKIMFCFLLCVYSSSNLTKD